MKIVIIGGHHISALVLAKKLRERGIEILWFGIKYPRRGEPTIGEEYRQVTGAGFPFYILKAGKVHNDFLSFWRLPIGLVQSLYLLLRLRPALIVSFGGFVAPPVVLAGWLVGIKSITHEQTATAGLANRVLKYFCSRILLTWAQSAKYFPANKTIVTGLPIRDASKHHPQGNLVLVLGGRQGSHTINQLIFDNMRPLLQKYTLVHQTGDILQGQDYNRGLSLSRSLPEDLKGKYQVKKFLADEDFFDALSKARFIIARSGAHTVYDAAVVGTPAIFIPFPFSYASEQEKNASVFTSVGAGIIIDQNKLRSSSLWQAVSDMEGNYKSYLKAAHQLSQNTEKKATEKITDLIFAYINESKS